MTTPALIIDMHTHLFNANYLPLKEIFISRGVPKYLAKKLAKLILLLARKSKLRFRLPPATTLDISFESLLRSNISLHSTADPAQLQEEALGATLEDMILSQLYLEIEGIPDKFEATTAVENSELYSLLLELDVEFGDAESTATLDLYSGLGFIEVSFSNEAYSGVLEKSIFGGLRRMLKKFIRKVSSFVDGAGDFLDFALTMIDGEKKLLNRLEGYYTAQNTNFLLVHYMMDMEFPFDGNVRFDFYDKQLPKMTALEEHSNGSLIGFSAFDPIRCVELSLSDEEIIALVDMSLLLYGKVGFKFYPPMGYRAANNENQPRLEHVVDVFFDHCVAEGIPVFTHCTPVGFEQSPGISGSNCHPQYWEACLQKPGRENLILCFGHAGGGERRIGNKLIHGWLSGTADEENWNEEDNYARWVVRLCRQYKNVYCEIAYMHEIIGHSGNSDKFRERLIIEYSRAVDAAHPYALGGKMMYGSDWHMPSMINDIDDYIRDVLQIFTDDGLAAHREAFFAGNAIRYLDLNNHLDRVSNLFGEEYVSGVRQRIAVM